ncbi:MAG: diaminopimelate epimerase [Acidobacteria bacterium]|nr:diaminopimelate epimerase [Acidobacteriota bacterium]
MSLRDIPFSKAHGLGNDFLIVDKADLGTTSPGALALKICDRHCGVGADGLVVLSEITNNGATFRIFNSDGSEAGLSGNAVRCAGAWLASRSASPATQFSLETKVGRRELQFLKMDGAKYIFRTAIGKPSFAIKDVPFHPPHPVTEPVVAFPLPVGDIEVPVTILSMGNPQCIHIVGNWETIDWRGLGQEMERHPYFPDRANIGFVKIVSDSRVEARFWERGAGYTQASGTGSCACAIAAHLSGRTGRRVTVAVERGEMEVFWRDDAMVELTGPAEIVVKGEFSFEGD